MIRQKKPFFSFYSSNILIQLSSFSQYSFKKRRYIKNCKTTKKRKDETMKKKIAVFITTAFIISGLPGCTNANAQDQTQEQPSISAQQPEMGKMVLGKVTEVQEDALVLELGKEVRPENAKPNPDGTTPPEKPDFEEGSTPPEKPDFEEGAAPPEKPDFEEGAAPPDGQKPNAGGGRHHQINWTGETTTISLNENCTIFLLQGKDKAEGTLQDIQPDNIVRLNYTMDENGNETLTTIEVQQANPETPPVNPEASLSETQSE